MLIILPITIHQNALFELEPETFGQMDYQVANQLTVLGAMQDFATNTCTVLYYGMLNVTMSVGRKIVAWKSADEVKLAGLALQV